MRPYVGDQLAIRALACALGVPELARRSLPHLDGRGLLGHIVHQDRGRTNGGGEFGGTFKFRPPDAIWASRDLLQSAAIPVTSGPHDELAEGLALINVYAS